MKNILFINLFIFGSAFGSMDKKIETYINELAVNSILRNTHANPRGIIEAARKRAQQDLELERILFQRMISRIRADKKDSLLRQVLERNAVNRDLEESKIAERAILKRYEDNSSSK